MDIVDHCIRHIILDGVSLFDPGSDLARGTVNIFRVQLLNIRIEALSHELDLLIQLLVARMISRRNDKRACIGDPLRIFPGIKIKERISEVAIAANKAIGITNGPSHTEIKVTKKGPMIVELGARLGGDCITTHLVPLSTGVNMVECSIKIALGERPNLEIKWNKGSAIRYLKTGKGVVEEIIGVDEAKKIPGVVQIAIVSEVGEQVGEIRSSVDRAGFVITEGSDASVASHIAEKASNRISFITRG